MLYGRFVEQLSPKFARVDVVSAGPHADGSPTAPPAYPTNVRVIRCAPPSWRLRRSLVTRFFSEVWFSSRNAFVAARPSADWTVPLSSSPPPLGAGATLVARWRRIPSIWWVQDLHPEIVVALGLVSDRCVSFRLLHAVHAWILTRVGLVIAISEAQRRALLDAYTGVPAYRHTSPNICRCSANGKGYSSRPAVPRSLACCRAHGWALGMFLVLDLVEIGARRDEVGDKGLEFLFLER